MNEKTETLKNWILKGDHDLGTAILTFTHLPKYQDTVAFHCQQSVEKYLKAYLIYLDITFKRSHDLNYLLSLIAQKDNFGDEINDKASELESFAIEVRYPDTILELSDDAIIRAIKIAKEFREIILKKINLDIDTDKIIES